VAVFGVAKEAARFDLLLSDVDHAGGHAPHGDFIERMGFVSDRRAGTDPCVGSDVLITSQILLQEFVVFQVDGLVSALHLQPLFIAGGPFVLVQDEDVGSEVGNAVGDIEIHPIDDGHHDDQSGDGNHHPQESEKGTELVGAQGF
jgi:hypothetical protein